ncbi:TIGR01548 family HAD-type hydrolase [Halocatena halophila]|uniref:TIGR01548 family HAD-type hydrolase n=1 Tax=Halocatena halophila TaxID=2814576 RepID=UPI002ED5D1C3
MTVDAIVLDIDGVLIDVHDSYRRAVVESVEQVYGTTVSKSAIQPFKNASGFNNDWELTHAIALYVLARNEGLELDIPSFTNEVAIVGGGRQGARTVVADSLDPAARERVLTAWDPERLTTVFQQLYLGSELYEQLHDATATLDTTGFIHDEPVLLEPSTRDRLDDWELGVFTGRPGAEATIALDRVGLEIAKERCYTMDSPTPGKPAPDALCEIAASMARCETVAFVGDTLDDIETAHNANETDDDHTYVPVGVETGGLNGEEGRQLLADAGAKIVVESINELPVALT